MDSLIKQHVNQQLQSIIIRLNLIVSQNGFCLTHFFVPIEAKMNFIKKTLLPSSKCPPNIGVLCPNIYGDAEHKHKELQKQLSQQYQLLKSQNANIRKYVTYIGLLQELVDSKNSQKSKKIQTFKSSLNFNNKKKQHQIPLLSAFMNFSSVQRYKFMIDTLRQASVKQDRLQKEKKKSQPLGNSRVPSRKDSIQNQRCKIIADASISLNELKTISLSYWTKVNFQLNIHKRQIIVTGKQSFIVFLQNYLVRLSKKQKYCFVLLSCNNQNVPSWLRRIYIHLKKQIFADVFQIIWNQIIYIQLEKMTASFQEVNRETQISPVKSKKEDLLQEHQDQFQIEEGDYQVFLTPLLIKNYTSDKNKIKNKLKFKMKFSQYKQIQFNRLQCESINQKLDKITFSKAVDEKGHQFHKVKGDFNWPASVLKFKFMDSLKQRNKYILSWNVLQRQNQNNMQAISQFFSFQQVFLNQKNFPSQILRFKQLILKEQTVNYSKDDDQEITFLKSIRQLQKSAFLNFLLVQCKKVSNEKSQLYLTCSFNKNIVQGKIRKLRLQILSKQQVLQMNKKIIESFLKQMVMMMFSHVKIYEQKQVDSQQFFSICQSFSSEIDQVDIFSSSQAQFDQDHSSQSEKRNFEFFNKNIESGCSNNSSKFAKNKTKKKVSFDDHQMIESPQFQGPDQMNGRNLRKSQSMQQRASCQEIQQQNKKRSCLKYRHCLYPLQKTKVPCLVKRKLLEQDWKRLDQGGLVCINQRKIKQQKQVLKKVLARLGHNIINKKSIMNVSLPVTIFKTESQLTTIARALTYAPLFLEPHCFSKKQGKVDYVQRMKNLICFLISNNYAQINFQKPFNPILGQTLQVWIDGCPVYFEQISHHPQTSYFYFLGRGFRIYGAIQPKVSMGVNHAKVFSWCIKRIQFDDGTIVKIGPNRMIVNGTIFGQRTFNLNQKNFVYDVDNNLLAVVSFGPSKMGLFTSSQKPLDFFSGKIVRMTAKFGQEEYQKWKQRLDYVIRKQWVQEQICSFEGIWSQKVTFDCLQYFDFEKQLPYQLVEQPNPIASDSRFRQDLQQLIKGDLEKSQQMKQKMEDRQRRDKKLRTRPQMKL